MGADGIDCFHRSLDFLFSISLISFQHHVQLRRKCSYRSTHWQWEDYLCGVCSAATSSANTWLQMCLRNSIAVPCWPGMSIEKKLARTVHSSVVTCAPCVHSAFVAYVFCYKVNLISCFWKLPFSPLSAQISCFPAFCCGILFFLRFQRLSCFPRLASVVFFSLAWLWLSSFPALCYVILVFPRLAPVALFSYAWLGFLVFPRLVCLLVFPRLSPNGLFFPRLAPVALFFPPRLVSVFFALDSYDIKYFLALYSLLGFPHRLNVFMIRFSDATNDLKHIIHPEFNYVDIRTAWGCKFLIIFHRISRDVKTCLVNKPITYPFYLFGLVCSAFM